jgi:hypothetical protein
MTGSKRSTGGKPVHAGKTPVNKVPTTTTGKTLPPKIVPPAPKKGKG